MATTVIQEDIGTVIEVDAGEDISQATGLEIVIEKPGGAVIVKTGGDVTFTTTGSDGKLRTMIEAGDLDEWGYYKTQAGYTLGAWTGRTATGGFVSERKLQ